VPESSRPREEVENHRRACTEVLFQGIFSLFRNSDKMAGAFHYVWNWTQDSSESFVLVENQRFFIKVKNRPTLLSIIVKPGYTQKRDSEPNPWTLVQDPFGCTSASSALENHS
jgi:hypothetical protein